MKVIDLTKTLEHGMEGYPGDPPVHIREVQTLEKEGWRLKQLRLGSHAGTHVDAPYHMVQKGKGLDDIGIEHFFGKAVVAEHDAPEFPKGVGLIFRAGEIDAALLQKITDANVPFVATGDDASLEIALERALLERDILTFTDLINLSKLPTGKEFMFYGIPLKIKNGDGSPIRAFAILEGI
jgi:arylformamidase